MERKVVLITGGAMGQGKSHALKFAENGFDVVLADMQDPEGWLPEGWKSSEEQAKVLNTKNYNIPGMVKTPVFWVMVIMFIFANAAGTMMVSATSPIAQNQIG